MTKIQWLSSTREIVFQESVKPALTKAHRIAVLPSIQDSQDGHLAYRVNHEHQYCLVRQLSKLAISFRLIRC